MSKSAPKKTIGKKLFNFMFFVFTQVLIRKD